MQTGAKLLEAVTCGRFPHFCQEEKKSSGRSRALQTQQKGFCPTRYAKLLHSAPERFRGGPQRPDLSNNDFDRVSCFAVSH